jgi:hypothetical protein
VYVHPEADVYPGDIIIIIIIYTALDMLKKGATMCRCSS